MSEEEILDFLKEEELLNYFQGHNFCKNYYIESWLHSRRGSKSEKIFLKTILEDLPQISITEEKVEEIEQKPEIKPQPLPETAQEIILAWMPLITTFAMLGMVIDLLKKYAQFQW